MVNAIKATALVMAGKRSGVLDPLAERAGVSQKAVVPVNGVPMIERVVAQVAACETFLRRLGTRLVNGNP